VKHLLRRDRQTAATCSGGADYMLSLRLSIPMAAALHALQRSSFRPTPPRGRAPRTVRPALLPPSLGWSRDLIGASSGLGVSFCGRLDAAERTKNRTWLRMAPGERYLISQLLRPVSRETCSPDAEECRPWLCLSAASPCWWTLDHASSRFGNSRALERLGSPDV